MPNYPNKEKGTLYFNDPFGKYNPLTVTNNGFLGGGYYDGCDIRIDVQTVKPDQPFYLSVVGPRNVRVVKQTENGKPLYLTAQIARAGALALDEETFKARNEPTAYAFLEYNLQGNMFKLVSKLKNKFQLDHSLGVPVSYSQILNGNGSWYPLSKEEFEWFSFSEEERAGKKMVPFHGWSSFINMKRKPGNLEMGQLYLDDPFGRFDAGLIENSMLQGHDIRVTMHTNTTLTLQIANAGALALDEETFKARNEPTVYMKIDHDHLFKRSDTLTIYSDVNFDTPPKTDFQVGLATAIGQFDYVHSLGKPAWYFVMDNDGIGCYYEKRERYDGFFSRTDKR